MPRDAAVFVLDIDEACFLGRCFGVFHHAIITGDPGAAV
jgi:hypothetical protein